ARYNLLKNGQHLTPTWVFIDEVQTYIWDDVLFAGALNKLREARVGTMLAMHFLDQIKMQEVKEAIKINTAIKLSAIGTKDYQWQCEAPGFLGRVVFPKTDFTVMPQSSREEQQELLNLSRQKFARVVVPRRPGERAQSQPPQP